jgi:predicted branched-subunit amino acid permease
MTHLSSDPAIAADNPAYWFRRGMRECISVAALILFTAHVGFAGLAMEAGIPMPLAVFMVVVIWALPAMVVLIGAIMSGAGLVAAALAVALSSIRLTPMVVALVPELRGSATRRITLYLLAHFIAVTSWVIAMEKVRHVPREMRTSFYAGLGATLIVANACIVAIVYSLLGSLPPVVAAALFLLTPMYFLTSMWGSAREQASHIAMVLGLVIGPFMHRVLPGFELVAAGVIGGGFAYAVHRIRHRKAGA